MDEVVQRFLVAPPSTPGIAALLEDTLRDVEKCVSYISKQTNKHRLSLLSNPCYSTCIVGSVEKQLETLEHWCREGNDAEQHLEALLHYLQHLLQRCLQAEEEKAAPAGLGATSSKEKEPMPRRVAEGTIVHIPPPVLHHSITLVKRYKTELSGALLKASVVILQEKKSGCVGTIMASSGESSGVASKYSRNKRQTLLSNQEVLKSLVRTRAALCIELQKVEGAFEEIKKDTQSMDALHESLIDVSDTMGKTKGLTKRLVAIESVEHIALNASFLIFFGTIAYIWLQRVFGFFPTIV